MHLLPISIEDRINNYKTLIHSQGKCQIWYVRHCNRTEKKMKRIKFVNEYRAMNCISVIDAWQDYLDL